MLASCLLTPRSPFSKILKRAGFLIPMRRYPFIIRINSDAVDAEFLRNVDNWHITFGDGDFV